MKKVAPTRTAENSSDMHRLCESVAYSTSIRMYYMTDQELAERCCKARYIHSVCATGWAPFCLKWCHGCHLKIMRSNRKSVYVSRCMPKDHFCQFLSLGLSDFKRQTALVFFEEVAPTRTRRTTTTKTRWVVIAYQISSWSNKFNVLKKTASAC